MYHFRLTSIEDFITAAGIMADDEKAYISGNELRESVPIFIGIRDDILECHALCTSMGAPDMGGGIDGLVKRLRWLKETGTSKSM